MKRIILTSISIVLVLVMTSSCSLFGGKKTVTSQTASETQTVSQTAKGDTKTDTDTTSVTQSTLTSQNAAGTTAGTTGKMATATTTKPTTIKAPTDPPPMSALVALGHNIKTIGATVKSPNTNTTYKLVFIDDFNGTALNSDNWTVFTKNYNAAEEQVNIPENIEVKGGYLYIHGKKESVSRSGQATDGSWHTSNYTGGAINSNGKKTFQFGRIEMKATMPYSQGMWPAFWTMGVKRGWPWGGEIDIVEMVGGNDQWNNKNRDGQVHSGIHWCRPEATSDTAYSSDHKSTGGEFDIPERYMGGKLADDYHVFGVEWTSTSMMFYLDDVMFKEISITDTTMREAFFQKHFMIINLAIGGSWAGSPDSHSKTVWPQKLMVDWVKVWQK